MNPILLIISAILPIVTTKLTQFKVISPTTASLINGIEGAATAFGTEVTANGSSVTATSLLAALNAALTVLQQQPGITSNALVLIAALTSAIQAGLTATAITAVDPTALAPVTPA